MSIRRIKRAWCELMGGHSDVLNQAWSGERTTHVRLYCSRCQRTTRWYRTPDLKERPAPLPASQDQG